MNDKMRTFVWPLHSSHAPVRTVRSRTNKWKHYINWLTYTPFYGNKMMLWASELAVFGLSIHSFIQFVSLQTFTSRIQSHLPNFLINFILNVNTSLADMRASKWKRLKKVCTCEQWAQNSTACVLSTVLWMTAISRSPYMPSSFANMKISEQSRTLSASNHIIHISP